MIENERPWYLPDARGWIGLASFTLTLIVMAILWFSPELRRDDFFKTVATLIVGSGWTSTVLPWAFGATKTGGELARANSRTLEHRPDGGATLPVNPPSPATASDAGELPIADRVR